MEPDTGQVSRGHGLEIGYFDQHLDGLDEQVPVVDAIRPHGKEFDLQQRRNLLARYGLCGDAAEQPVGSLSGGERCRAALARLAASGANFLVLDEPTNHLDLWARGALERALRKFAGTVLLVSHDRYFVNQVADHVLAIEPGRVRVVEGGYETYLHQVGRSAGALPAGAVPAEDAKPKPARTEAKTAAAAKGNKRKFPYRKVADIEAEIFQREERLEELHALLAEPDTYRDGDRIRTLQAEIDEQTQAIAVLYEHWEEATDLNW
jgi:ATP-binding cassette subfamily F protein 3